jgi:hypothetical protein
VDYNSRHQHDLSQLLEFLNLSHSRSTQRELDGIGTIGKVNYNSRHQHDLSQLLVFLNLSHFFFCTTGIRRDRNYWQGEAINTIYRNSQSTLSYHTLCSAPRELDGIGTIGKVNYNSSHQHDLLQITEFFHLDIIYYILHNEYQ